VPAGQNFLLDPQGVVSYGGSADFNGHNPSWLVKDSINLESFNYDYFSRLVSPSAFPCDVGKATGCWNNKNNLPSGNYRYSGDLNLPSSPININERKIVVLVEGDLKINEKIRVADDSFLAFIVKGNIEINGNVTETGINPALEGIYFADGTIATGVSDKILVAKGIFVAQKGFSLQRDLGGANENTPAETFVFDPGLLVKMPNALKKSLMDWQEVAP